MALYNSFADTVTLDDLKEQEISRGKTFPVPKIAGGRPQNIVAKRSEQVAEFMGTPELEMVGGQPVFQFDPLNADTFTIVPQDNGSVSFSIFDEDGGGMKRFDLGLGLKFGVEFCKKIQVAFGYDWGLIDNADHIDNKNRNMMISLSYMF